MANRKTSRRARPAQPPIIVNEQALTAAQALAFRAAEQLGRSDQFDRRARAAARLQALEADLERRRGEAEVRAGLAESLALAKARGEIVEAPNRGEAMAHVRIRSRDGLETLARSGAITPLQFRAGLLYRQLYEGQDPERGLRSQMAAPAFVQGGSVTGSAAPPEAWALRRMRLAGRVAEIDAKVRVADRNGRAVTVLREIAGHARCASHVVAGGGGQARAREALILALDIVVAHFAMR